MPLPILNLLLVLLAAWAAGLLASRLGYPSVLGELLVGIVLGPPLLGLLEGGEALAVLAEAGILLMMAYIGMEIDPKELARASKAGFLTAIGGFITPFVLVYFVVVWSGGTVLAGIFVGIAAGVTSLATKSRILVDLKLLDTRIAHVMMAAALIADTLSLLVFAVVIGVAQSGEADAVATLWTATKALIFFGLATLAGLKVLPWMGGKLSGWRTVGKTARFTFAVIVTLLYAEAAELAGMHGILGAFLAGLFLRDDVFGYRTSKEVMGAVRDASIGFLAPIFFVTAGFSVSLSVFTTSLGLLVLIVLLATVGKIVGTVLFYLPTGFGWREGLAVGAGMNGRGAVEIIVAQIGLSMGLIDQEIFSILVFMAIFTTATVPVFLKWGTDWLRRRDELVRSDEKRSGTVIVGAGPMARNVAQVLSVGGPVWIIDRNKENCAQAAEEGLIAICGNALDEEEFARANAAKAQTLLAMTPNAEVNALVGEMARKVFFVPQIHLLDTGDSAGHEAMLEHLKASTAFGEAVDLNAWDYFVDHGKVEEIRIPVESELDTVVVPSDIRDNEFSLPVALERDGARALYHGASAVRPGDTLIAVRFLREDTDRVMEILSTCPILDVERDVSPDAFFGMVAGLMAPRLDMRADMVAERLQHPDHIRNVVLVPGVAVPHVFVEGHGVFEMVVARSRNGISFPGEVDPVKTAFVIVGSYDERNFHLRALATIAHILEQPGFDTAWAKAPDVEALRQILLSA